MWLLDTDHFAILERGGSTTLSLQMRSGQVAAAKLATALQCWL